MHTLKIYKDEICLNDNTFIDINDDMWSILGEIFDHLSYVELYSSSVLFVGTFVVEVGVYEDLVESLYKLFDAMDVEIEITDERNDTNGLVL